MNISGKICVAFVDFAQLNLDLQNYVPRIFILKRSYSGRLSLVYNGETEPIIEDISVSAIVIAQALGTSDLAVKNTLHLMGPVNNGCRLGLLFADRRAKAAYLCRPAFLEEMVVVRVLGVVKFRKKE